MASTTARTQTDVNNMTKAERLWDSLNYSYGKKREDLAQQYAQAASQTDRALLGRGMQRSSYGAQTVANLQQQGLKAQSDVWDTQIADYENRLQEAEQQEWAQGFQERQFDEGIRQYEQNFGYQAGRDTVADQQWQLAFDQGNKDNDRSLAASYVNALLGKGQMPTDDLLARAGLSKADAQKMIAQQAVAGGGGRSSGNGDSDEEKGDTNANDWMAKFLYGGGEVSLENYNGKTYRYYQTPDRVNKSTKNGVDTTQLIRSKTSW